MSDPPARHSSSGTFHLEGSGPLRIAQNIRAPAAVIWQACATLEGIAAWQADAAAGSVEPGGALELAWPELGASVLLDVVAVEEHRRLELRNGATTLEILLTGGGVRLTQSGLQEGDDWSGMASSWRVSLALLAHYCERHPGRPRHVTWFSGVTPTSAEAAHHFFTDRRALTTWLKQGGEVGSEGSPLELELESGRRLSGKVLANVPGRDVALSWSETNDSVVCLRTLPGPSDDRRVVLLTWSRWASDPPLRGLVEELGAAHGRLLARLDRTRWT
jgi:uncharacterized protein YndB with AHSA1/START domain